MELLNQRKRGRPQIMQYHPIMAKLLKKSGMTMDQFKDATGLSYGTAHSVMVNGLSGKTWETIKKCANAFGLAASVFVELMDNYEQKSTNDR